VKHEIEAVKWTARKLILYAGPKPVFADGDCLALARSGDDDEDMLPPR
jgi:hypothetical protein